MTSFLSKKLMARMALFTLVGLLFSSVAFAQNDSSAEESKTKVKTSAKKSSKKANDANASNPTLANLQGGGSGWRLQGSLTHVPKLRRDQEDTTDILLRADYNINKKHTIRVQQFLTKFYGKYESENEFKPFDTSVAHFYRLGWKPFGIGLQWRNQFSIPISNESSRDNLTTVYRTSAVASKALLGGKLLAFGIPYFRYFAYEFKTSKSGRLLPRYQMGMSLGALYFFTSKLSLYAGGDYRDTTVYKVVQSEKQIPRGTYRYDMSLAYQWTNALSTSVDYAQGASYIQDGRYEVAIFDDQNTRVGLGLTYVY